MGIKSIASAIVVLILSSSNCAFAASVASVSAKYSGFVYSISDPSGALSGAIGVGDMVNSNFLITTEVIEVAPNRPECGAGGYGGGNDDISTICRYYNSTTHAASLTVGDTDFNNIDLILNEVWVGQFNGDGYSQILMNGIASASSLGWVALELQFQETGRYFPALWPSEEDINVSLSGVPYIGCISTDCSISGPAITFLMITGDQYQVKSALTDFELKVSSVPVPAAAWLFGSGLIGLIGIARRK